MIKMALLQRKAFTTGAAQKATRRTSVRVCCAAQGDGNVQKAQAFAAAFAAAALLHTAPASAGVILEQPQVKKVFQSDAAPAAPVKKDIILPGQRSKTAAAPAAAAEKPKAAPRVAETSGADLDPRAVALPASLAVIAGGAFALSKIDEGFGEFIETASCKDSGSDGAGYEEAIKGGGALAVAGKSRAGSKAGTKKVKAATKSGGSPLASFFEK